MSASLVCFRSGARVDLGARSAGREIRARADGTMTEGRGRQWVGIPRPGRVGAPDGEARGLVPVGRRLSSSRRSRAKPRSSGSCPLWERSRSTRTDGGCPDYDRTSLLPRFTSRSRGPTVCKPTAGPPIAQRIPVSPESCPPEPYAIGDRRVGLLGHYRVALFAIT
jgi:hypothetical protein